MGGLSDNQLRLTHTEKKQLVILNSDIDVQETYIVINNHTIGSSNNNFVIYEKDNNIFSLNSSNLYFNQDVATNNIIVSDQTTLQDVVVNNSLTINNSNINFNNSQIFTESNIIFNKDITVDKAYTDTLYVNTIDNLNGCNIEIKNLQLSESKFNNPEFTNSVNIKNVDSQNIIQIDILDNNNLLNILKAEDLFEINNNGSIIIQNTLQLNKNSLYFCNLSIDNNNCLSIGKTKHPVEVIDYNTKLLWESNNASLLHIHHNNYKDYNIIKDPLLYISTDYNPESNIITKNYDQMPFVISNLQLFIDTDHQDVTEPIFDNYKVFFNFLPNNFSNIEWYKLPEQKNINNYGNNDDFTKNNEHFNLLVNNYDYNNYKLHVNQIVSKIISTSDSIEKYEVEMYIGYYLDSNIIPHINNVVDIHKNNIDVDISTSNESIYVGDLYIENTKMLDYHKIVENNYNLFPNACNIYIDFNIHLIYEKAVETTQIYFIDITPKTIPCPSIIQCEFNTNEILNLNSNGLLTVKEIDTNKGKIDYLNVSQIDNDVNFMNCNLDNVNNLNVNSINVNVVTADTIKAQSVSTDNIKFIGGNKIIFTEINTDYFDTCNINSDYFKVNDSRTLILNQFTICDGILDNNDIIEYRDKQNITECLITNQSKILGNYNNSNVLYIDGNLKAMGNLSLNNFTINIDNDNLTLLDNNKLPSLQYGNNILQLGNYFNLLYNDVNKIWMGDYQNLMFFSGLEESIKLDFNTCKIYSETTSIENNGTINFNKRYENSFKQFYYNNYQIDDIERSNIEIHSKLFNFNMFGNLRLANTKNDTILEIGDLHNTPTYTMNVFGNIKCCKPFKIELDPEDNSITNREFYNNIALDVEGDTQINGSLNISEHLDCKQYIKTEQYIEAKQGVRNISDLRVKTELKLITNSLQKIKQLSGYTFKRKDLNGVKDTGLIAQDVNKVLPEVINIDPNGYLNIDYSKMMGLMVEAIKELDNKISLIK